MVAAFSRPVLPDLPRDVSPSVRSALIGGVLVVHAVVATLVVLTSRLPSVVAEAAPISVSLLTRAPSGELVSAVPPVVQTHPVAPVSKSVAPSPAVVMPTVTPQVAAVAAPAQVNDMVVPVAPAMVDRKALVDAPVAVSASRSTSVATPSAEPSSQDGQSMPPVHVVQTAIEYVDQASCTPRYPDISKRLEEAGVVVVVAAVDTKGYAESVTLKQSSGYYRLDNLAVQTIKACRFIPPTVNGVPRRMATNISFRFGFSASP